LFIRLESGKHARFCSRKNIPEGAVMKSKPRLLLLKSMFFFLVALSLLPGSAASQTSFFQGKTITIIQGRDPGGTGDLRVRALFPFLQKYIPGNPTVVSEYMPGGGSRKAANHIFRNSRPDGLTIGNFSSAMVSLAVLGESGVLYDIDKFHYLGSPYSTYHAVFVSRKEAGFNTIEKLRAASGIKIGAQSLGFSTYIEGRLFAYMLGLKDPLFIAAFGGAELDPALMRGEIDARATGPDTILARNRDWIDKGLADIHAIMETPKGEKHPHPLFAKLPEIESFARNDKERKIIALQRAFRIAGTPFVLPPGTSKDRVEVLQEAFRKTYRDPEFAKEYRKLTADDPTPLLPENHEKAIREIPRDPEVIELFKVLVGPKKLPPR
jgi:tripartite-type tricarboxylate transporter receptor subunit TctC